MSVLFTSLRFTFTPVKSRINTSAFPKSIFLFIILLKYRMQVLLPSLVLGSHKFTKRSTPAEMTGLNELISEWGLPLMDSVLHVAQRKRRSCSQQQQKNGNTTKTAEKGSRNICVIQISCVTSKETIYLSLFHLIGSSFSKIAV